MLRRLEVILKLSERCNIACKYCYYFEDEERSALQRPSRLTPAAADQFVVRVDEAIGSQLCEELRIVFHGGEPLMYGKERFRVLCSALRAIREPERVALCMQTNAMLIDDEWIDIFEEFDIAVGVSIDGPKEIHDKERIDKRGRGTYHQVVAGIRRLIAAAAVSRISRPGALVVMQKGTDGRRIYDHLTGELGIRLLDFLLPDDTWDSAAGTEWVGPYLCS